MHRIFTEYLINVERIFKETTKILKTAKNVKKKNLESRSKFGLRTAQKKVSEIPIQLKIQAVDQLKLNNLAISWLNHGSRADFVFIHASLKER